MEELISSFMTHELNVNQEKEEEVKKKKSIALKAIAIHKEESDSEEDFENDEGMAMIARRFKKFMRRKKNLNQGEGTAREIVAKRKRRKKKKNSIFAMNIKSPNIFGWIVHF